MLSQHVSEGRHLHRTKAKSTESRRDICSVLCAQWCGYAAPSATTSLHWNPGENEPLHGKDRRRRANPSQVEQMVTCREFPKKRQMPLAMAAFNWSNGSTNRLWSNDTQRRGVASK